ncbi:MAG: efflux RND transporter periplasmic adaptor subunit [Campylobacterota bacterium]|nr:efflux RND transporter periplasmic adaptor subunit [Campylobacterota bacterium]
MSKKKIIITIVAVVVLAGVLISAKRLLETRKAAIANEALPEAMGVTVAVVHPKEGTLQNRDAYLAQIISDKSIKLSTKLAGYIEEVLVEESQQVKKGDTLVRIDDTELLSNIQALNATLATQLADARLAKSIYARNVKLYNVGGLAKEKLEISKVTKKAKEAIYKSTKERVSQLEHQRSYLKIVSPFDGYVDMIHLYEGDLAASGKAILSMSSGEKKLLFSYAPVDYNRIKKEQKVFIANKEVGEVKTIYTTSQNGLIGAEVQLNETVALPVGSSLNIEVLTKEATGCVVPNNAILHKKEGVFVMAYEEGEFSLKKVNIEMTEADKLLISPCPKTVAKASEVKLAQLAAYKKVKVVEESPRGTK